MTQLVKDLFDLPAQVAKSDFVLDLNSGVANPQRTADTYVVTERLKDAFDRCLTLVSSALGDCRSKATYLHGSFGSGKSHFMAVLSLLIDGNEAVWQLPALHPLRAKHAFVGQKQLLQLRYHMIGADNLESKLLGEYVDFVKRTHPEAPLPNVFADQELFDNARSTLAAVGDEAFFARMGGEVSEGWGKLRTAWNRERFEEHATSEDPKLREKLFAALVEKDSWFPAYVQSGRYVDIDSGLAAMARHAQSLGYDGIVLYLDELILWLSHRASQQEWLHNEVQKMVKLVESQESARAVPIVSLIARQRNLAEMVGKMHTGMEHQLLYDSLNHWEGRFDKIDLEDSNLPAIIEKRVLRPKNDEALAAISKAFEQLRAGAGKSLETLQGTEDLAAFRKVYPFSPALVASLIALSSSLQRERTAIKMLMELLVEHIPDLPIGEVVRVGDLFDVLAGGEDPADGVMRARFTSAKELYKHHFLPLIQESNGTNTPERCQRLRDDHPVRLGCSGCSEKQCRVDNRIIKTLLTAALVPEVDALKDLTVSRLTRLNHGMVKSMIPGQEAGIVAGKIRKWASSIAQVQIGNEADPSVKLRLEGVDLKPILERYAPQDTPGTRQRVVRELLFEALGLDPVHTPDKTISQTFRGTTRYGALVFGNIRAMSATTLRCEDGHDFRLLIDYPFDDPGKSPHDDVETLEKFKESGGSWTLAWVPHFFSDQVKQLLGELVVLNYVLESKLTQREAVQHLTPENQTRALSDIENLRSQKRSRLLNALSQAYGLTTRDDADIDTGNMVDTHLHVLKPGAPPLNADLAANLSSAREAYVQALLALRYPRHPEFTRPLTPKRVNDLVDKFAELVATEEGRLPVDRELRSELAGTLGALGLLRFSETHALKAEETLLQPLDNRRAQKGADRPQVSEVRQWIDEGRMGLQESALDLVVRCYAVWARRTLELDGRPLDGRQHRGPLPDRAVLEKPELPTQQEWKTALELAATCFGVTFAGKHLSPDNLGQLRARLDVKLTEVDKRCVEVNSLLGRRAAELGVAPDAPRLRTSQSAERLVVALRGQSGVAQVRILAGSAVETSPAAVGRHLGDKLADLERTLADGLVFSPLRQLQLRKAEVRGATQILDDVVTAFRQDELNVQLAPRLRELAQRAQELFTHDAVSTQTIRAESTTPDVDSVGSVTLESTRTFRVSARGKSDISQRLAELTRELEQELSDPDVDFELDGALTLRKK
jgi:hypothetical protein